MENEMKLDEKILNETFRCEKTFDCLKNKDHVYCKVENSSFENILFVKCLSADVCSYKTSFGTSFMCNCPTRNEIFKKYRL